MDGKCRVGRKSTATYTNEGVRLEVAKHRGYGLQSHNDRRARVFGVLEL